MSLAGAVLVLLRRENLHFIWTEIEVALAIRELPSAERPRERLRAHGAHALSSSELIAILLGSGSEGRSALGIGQEILSTCRGSLRLLATPPVATLTSVRGVGTARAVGIHAALELGRRMAAEERQEGAPVRWRARGFGY